MRAWTVLPLVLSLAACASVAPQRESARLALYRAHAGAPIPSFRYFGRMDSWESFGDRALAVWTHPGEAYLLDLDGPCEGLDFAIAIGLTAHTGQVSARFDDVLVRQPGPHIPCRIGTIRPLDVAAIRAAERARNAQASGT
ncbi:MAG: hypothetical protein HOQ02_09780 [Lysobacter sp.]|nr:hypothetical protein [Lysobacter sp.]